MRLSMCIVALLCLGFDHADHVAKAPAECRDCHRGDRKTGHKQCFGACHAKPKKFKKGDRAAPLCAACHTASASDFSIVMSHGTHEGETSCKSCHDARGHKRCGPCHKATAPTFESCDGCHGALAPAASTAGRIPLGEWSHPAHAKKAPAAECRTCHPTTDAPAPSKADCAACHTMVDRCTSCHREAPPTPPPLVRPSQRFSHDEHKGRIATAADCASCHALDRRGEATVPGHLACADAACHAADFATMTPVTCAACHTAIEPWRDLATDAPPKDATEFGSTMPHRTHASLGLACASCHAVADAERELRPPHGHSTCTGDACHAVGRAEPAPALDRCDGCHRAGVVAARVQERLGARWTVRARFTHAPHEGDCATCHTSVWDVDGPPPAPAKATCRGCHDGKTSFKMTGHRCARCHGSSR